MTENMQATFEWLKTEGFMATREETEDLLVRNRGYVDGAAAGSWVIDGNTSDDTCRAVLEGLNDCDPMVLDSLPTLQLGEWADDPSLEEILEDLGIEVDEDMPEAVDDLFCTYSDAWSEGLHAEVERACLARTTRSITDRDETKP